MSSLNAAFELFDASDDETNSTKVKQEIVQNKLIFSSSYKKNDEVSKKLENEKEKKSQIKQYQPELWSDKLPIFMGPVLFTRIENMGRGYVAAEDISAGTLLFIEEVYLTWPDDLQEGNLLLVETLHRILISKEREKILNDIDYLHPTSLQDVPEELVFKAKEKYGDAIRSFQAKYCSLNLSFNYLLQKILAMQCSAFSSGIFLHLSIYNHSCNPNCVKFTPVKNSNQSEVRAASSIKKGEQLTISYLFPIEQSYSLRQEQFQNQFGFTCCCLLCQSAIPSNPKLLILENQLKDAEFLLKTNKPTAALQLTIDAMSDALEIVSSHDIVFIRMHKIVTQSTLNLLKISKDHLEEHSILFLRSSLELLDIQKKFLNSNHYDFAVTWKDISEGIQMVLALDSEWKSLSYHFPEFTSFRNASQYENYSRKEHLRIKQLYE